MLFRKNKKFTLIELIVVIAILAILAAIVIPNIRGIQKKADEARKLANVRNLQTAVDMYSFDTGEYPTAERPVYRNEPIVWDKIYTDYVRNIPKANEGEVYYVDPNGLVVLNYGSDAYFLKWLKDSKMIVSDPSDSVYGGINPPSGIVFLNYNQETQKFEDFQHNTRTLTLSSAITGDALTESYKVTNDTVFLDRAKLIADNLVTLVQSYTLWGQTYYVISPRQSYNGSSWVIDSGEYYPKDSAIAAKFLIEYSKATGDTSYAQEGKKLLDTLIIAQNIVGSTGENTDLFAINGALPDSMTPTSMDFIRYPLDLGYMLYPAGEVATEYFNDDKYLNMGNKYISFVEKAFDNYNGLSTYGFPYEYIIYLGAPNAFQGQNQDQVEYANTGNYLASFGVNKPFTTDQFFYTVLGLKKANSNKAQDMFTKASELSDSNYKFWGQYNIDGTSASGELETCNTAFYLEIAKRFEPNLASSIENALLSVIINSSDINANSGWEWAAGENFIESLVSALAPQKILYQEGLSN